MKEKKLIVTFVNVGYGEAILLECPDSTRPNGVFTALIDGGGADASEFADRSSGRIPIGEYFSRRGMDRLDLIVSTHTHEDHISGLLQAARIAPPSILWQTLPVDFYKKLHPLDVSVAGNLSESKFLQALNDYWELCYLVEANGGVIANPETGEKTLLCSDLTAHILAPSANKRSELAKDTEALYHTATSDEFLRNLDALDARMNNYSLILSLEYCGTRLLLPGDTNLAGYEGIDPAAMQADLFKVGHHGQIDGIDRHLAEIIRPKAVVCCASSDRRYNSAHPDTMQMLLSCGAKLYFSDCPDVPGRTIPPHQALEFTMEPKGAINARYISTV